VARGEEFIGSELQEQEPVCEECGAEGATCESWADEGGHFVRLCEACAHPQCVRCREQIAGRPVWGWSDVLGDMVPLCDECAAEAGAEFEV
jgi:hypothetical protein